MRYPLFLLLLLFIGIPVGADLTNLQNEAAAAQVQVVNISMDPPVLMPYDTATVTFTVTNTGKESVAISRAEMYDKDIRILSDQYNAVGSIGAGNQMSFTYTIQAGGRSGIFYPVFSLDFRNAHFLRYPFKVQVQDNPLEVSVLKKPEVFVEGKSEDITLHLGNPRDNAVTGVSVTPLNGSFEIVPTSFFSGVLASDSSLDVPFRVTPHSGEPLVFQVVYQNGINQHILNYTLPVDLGTSKRKAHPILSNVVVEEENDQYKVTGDVTNSGLQNANAVEITTKDPAKPAFPYKVYAVGALKPDDFSGFEVTFRIDDPVSSVPLVASYKDDDGNLFTESTDVEIDSSLPDKKNEPLPSAAIVVGIGILAVLVMLLVWYSRRR